MTLYEKTKKLLAERPRTLELKQIAQETGIGFSWLRMFSAGNIKDPSVNTVERLYRYLSGKDLEL